MGDSAARRLGYMNMWVKTKDVLRTTTSPYPTKTLSVACEKRVPSGKLWIGSFCSMAMAAHAFDLVAETFGWSERHYGRSKFLVSKAAELKRALQDNYDVADPLVRDTVCRHADEYASLFPCSDSKYTLLTYFRLRLQAKFIGPKCRILVEKPLLVEEPYPKGDRYYPLYFLPPIAISDASTQNDYSPFDFLNKKRKQPPSPPAGTKEMQDEMGVEPDLVSCVILDDTGAQQNEGRAPCFYQQWTWCTRSSKSEMSQRRWNPPRVPYPSSPTTTFCEAPYFITGPKDSRPFSFLNYQIYQNINNVDLRKRTENVVCEWKGTTMNKFEPDKVTITDLDAE